MKKHLTSLKKQRGNCSIDDMESLLSQIAEFKHLVKSTRDSTDPAFIQEYRLFKQYVEWISEDLVSDSYICGTADDSVNLSHKNRH
ncbi:hypothetical protein MNBD_GAMMA09-891 [hydrothermal vent metagenome]|uniref:Uncharacterized protein n=1 Tax=hydrothermal vent metagenome TaxID=652676 RepID=A0A3B0XJM7_9ZZZZ